MNKTFYCYIILNIFLTSCVPIKDLVYLQDKQNGVSNKTLNAVFSDIYRLQTFDILSINIKTSDPKLSGLFSGSATTQTVQSNEQTLYSDGYTINNHGNVRIPVLGEIYVLGFTLDEVRIKIEEKLLSEYFNKASNLFVNVKLSGFRYTVNGEVGVPGTKILYQERVNILEAIANCGDITTVGDRKNVVIMRKLPQGIESHTIDLTDNKVLQSAYFNLQPNDYIYVKPLKQKTWGTGKTGIESLGTLITLISVATTTYLLLKK